MMEKPRFKVVATVKGWDFHGVKRDIYIGSISYNGNMSFFCRKYLESNHILK